MAYDEDLAERLRAALAGERFTEKAMFGGLAFLIGGHMSVAASGQGGLLVRVPPEETDALLAEPGAEEFAMRGRPMQGWLRVNPDVLDDDATVATWAGRGVAYAKTLPPK
ncbi:MAG TPA: TfoX/Sxy family protein [Mycobacteriales bacterium]|nr:TfoX/Sxy family protein [Mycobacteriales bacterium]